MRELIAKLEAAKGPCRELDDQIWLAIGNEQPARMGGYFCPFYTSSVDAALTLVPELVEKTEVFFGRARGEVPEAIVWRDENRGEAHAPTLPLAICIAALRAKYPDA